jgi:hypothetical protein
MTRTIYTIKQDGVKVAETFAWNSARRRVWAIAKEHATRINGAFELVSEQATKEGFGYIAGVYVWQGTNGEQITLQIIKA